MSTDSSSITSDQQRDSQAPLVSIIIPVHSCLELTQACLESIQKCTGIPHEIILIDDASDRETAVWLDRQASDHIRVIRNDARKNFSANNNAGAAVATGRYLCLLNNDTVVTEQWLNALVAFASAHPQAGVIGNKHLFPQSGLLHHCGMAVLESGDPQHLYPNSDPTAAKVNYPRKLQLVTFACVLIPANVYRELNGLDESYQNGFEDCDFCLRAGAAGYEVWYTPTSTLYHHGQSTPGRTNHDDQNWKLFLSRWNGRMEKDWGKRIREDQTYQQEYRTKRQRHARNDGWHFAVDFSQGSAFTWATAELIRHLLAHDLDISIDPTLSLHHGIDRELRKQLRPLLRKSPCNGCHVKWSHYWQTFMQKPLSGDINVEFFCTNYRQRPHTQSDVWMRHVEASHNRLLPIGRFNELALEDIGIAASRMSPIPLGYAPEIDRLFPHGVDANDDRDELHLFVITNSHDLERYGTDLLIEACSQAFSKHDPVILHIKDYGVTSGSRQIEDWIASRPQFPRVQWHRDFLSRDDLIRLYARMDILIAPFRGEGFGMKIVDAMALGLPVMMPDFGGPTEFAQPGTFIPIAHREVPVGLCYDRIHHHLSNGAYWCEAIVEDFVDRLKELPAQRSRLREIGSKARAHVQGRYSWANVAEQFIRITRQWQSERDQRVLLRHTPSPLDCSVVIPTKDRCDILQKTLQEYAHQKISRDRWELLLVNDGGDAEALNQAVAPFQNSVPLQVFNNPGSPGPAGARNAAVQQARGRIVLITGDDIIPDHRFIASHLEMHEQHPEQETAVLGKTLWSKDLTITPFMDYLTGEGGHQFAYDDLSHGGLASYDRFYTSNISLKRGFFNEEEQGFHTGFRYAAYEDIEFAYRLHLRGMKLRYHEKANGYHHHPMTPASFLKRQQLVGQMLTYLCLVQPSYVPPEHTVFLDALEYLRSNPDVVPQSQTQRTTADQFLQTLTDHFQHHLDVLAATQANPSPTRPCDRELYAAWLSQQCGSSWEAVNELALRTGMAKEWAHGDEQLEHAAMAWVMILAVPSILKKNTADLYDFSLQLSGAHHIPSPLLRFAIHSYQQLHRVPVLRTALIRFQQNRWFGILRQRLLTGS